MKMILGIEEEGLAPQAPTAHYLWDKPIDYARDIIDLLHQIERRKEGQARGLAPTDHKMRKGNVGYASLLVYDLLFGMKIFVPYD